MGSGFESQGIFPKEIFLPATSCTQLFYLLDQQKDPTFYALCDIEKVQACHFGWRSWLWQQNNIPGGHLSKQPRLLPVVTVGPSPLLHIAAHCAFWKLPKGVVVDCGKLVGAVVAASASLCQVLVQVVMKILGKSESQALDIVSQRLAANDDSQSFVEALLEIDEAAEVMDKQDLEQLTSEQKLARSERAEAEAFSKDFVDSRQRVAATQQKKQMSQSRRPLPNRIEQHEARRCTPPGASIWRGMTGRETWNGHMPPRKRIFMTLAEMGDDGAMRNILKRLWLQYLELNGKPASECPWSDLLS